MPDRRANLGGLEETAAEAAEAVAGNAGTGPAAGAHSVEGANYRPARTRRLSRRKDYFSKPAGTLCHRKFLCAQRPGQIAADHPVSLRPFAASAGRQG